MRKKRIPTWELPEVVRARTGKSGSDQNRIRDLRIKRSTPDIVQNDKAATALLYALRGWAVLPLFGIRDGVCRCPKGEDCKQPGQHPRTENGINDATTDPLRIHSWWVKWPSANIGLLTGAKSGIIVINVDPRKGAVKSLKVAIKELGELPLTLKTINGDDGSHFIFQYPKTGIRTASGKLLGRGLDVLSDGSYFVAPGSWHVSGEKYCWVKGKSIRNLDPAVLPESWLNALSEPLEMPVKAIAA